MFAVTLSRSPSEQKKIILSYLRTARNKRGGLLETIFKLDLRFDTYFRGMGVGVGTRPIRHFHISHNAPHLPPPPPNFS